MISKYKNVNFSKFPRRLSDLLYGKTVGIFVPHSYTRMFFNISLIGSEGETLMFLKCNTNQALIMS